MSKSGCLQATILHMKILGVSAEGAYKLSQGTLAQLSDFFFLCVTWK